MCTIELRLGQDAPTDTKSILSIADIKCRDGWMMGHLAEDRKRDSVRYSLYKHELISWM